MNEATEFERLLRSNEALLSRYCQRHATYNDDVLQEIRIKAYRNFSQFRPGTNFSAWIFRIASTTIVDAHRQSAYHRQYVAESPTNASEEYTLEEFVPDLAADPARIVQGYDSLDTFRTLLRRYLTIKESQVMEMLLLEELSVKDCSERLSISVQAVHERHNRAIAKLKTNLTPDEIYSIGF